MINFPATPTLNQEFVATPQVTFVWDGVTWKWKTSSTTTAMASAQAEPGKRYEKRTGGVADGL